jgi:rhamnosyltransferase
MKFTPRNPTVVAVVSAFNPSWDLVSRVKSHTEHVTHVVVVNDGSSNTDQSIWQGLNDAGVEVVHHSENLGVAAALNTGVAAAFDFDPEAWILALDQDSDLSDGYVNSALSTYRRLEAKGVRVGLVAPGKHNGFPVKLVKSEGSFREAFDPMQSGCLIPGAVIGTAGPLDETLFIDGVDTDFNARLRKLGYRLPADPGCNLHHELGNPRAVTILKRRIHFRGRPLALTYHPPLRVYYITRNSLVLARRYFRQSPSWMIQRLWMEVESNLVRVAFGPDRLAYILAWTYGIRDAVGSRMGRADAVTMKRLSHAHSSSRRAP